MKCPKCHNSKFVYEFFRTDRFVAYICEVCIKVFIRPPEKKGR